MIKKLQAIVLVGLFLGFISISEAAYSPKVNDDGTVVIAEFSNPKVWQLRGKGKSNPKINFASQTPLGKTAINIISQGSGEVLAWAGLVKKGGEWRNRKYKKLSFMIKNNGDKGFIRFRIFTYSGKNNHIFVYLPVKEKAWQKITVDLRKCINKGVYVSDVSIFRIKGDEKMNVSLGPITLIPVDSAVKTDRENKKIKTN